MAPPTILEDLTPDQDAVLDVVAAEYLAILQRGDKVDMDKVRPMLELIYSYYDKPVPDVEIIDSPEAALMRARDLGIQNPYFDWCGVGDAGWLAHYEVFARIGILNEEESADLRKMQAFLHGGIYDTILLDERALLIRFPSEIHTDERGNLHSAKGPAIAWRDGQAMHAWHGAFVSKELIEAPEAFTKEQVIALPTETRRAFCEHFGWEKTLALLECQLADTWADPKTALKYELYVGPDEKILRKESPALQDGSQPWYAEPVHRDLKTAQAARKWQAAMRRGEDPGAVASACNKNPALTYGVEA
jgi:hypothetical protein